jgi:hypothetical protein
MTNVQIMAPINDASDPSIVELPHNHIIRLPLIDALPAASATFRRCIVYTEGATGEADYLAVCRKNADDEYEWIALAPAQASFLLGSNSSWTGLDEVGSEIALGSSDNLYGALVTIDLTSYTEVRHIATVDAAGSAGSEMILQYSLDGSTNWTALTANPIDLADVSTQTTDWETLPVEARTLVALRFFASGGDGLEDPNILNNVLQARG